MNVSSLTADGFQFLDSSCPDSDRLHVFSGNLVRAINLFTIPTFAAPLSLSLYHNSLDIAEAGDVGIGWRHSLQATLTRVDPELMAYRDETGRRRDFELTSDGWRLKDDSLYEDLTLTDMGSGLWQLMQMPSSTTWEFEEQAGTPVVARLLRMVDGSNNPTEYVLNGDDRVVQILQPVSGQAIHLEWTAGRLTAVEDMEENRFVLTYGGDYLTSLEMPGGCLVDFTYHSDGRVASRTSGGASTLYAYDGEGRLTEIQGPLEGGSRPTASWVYAPDPVQEVANLSPVTETEGEFIDLKQVFFSNARGKIREFRFLPSGMLWREISPMGRHSRHFYDDRQNLLYSSQGYHRRNVDEPDAGQAGLYEHPRDNLNNQFRFLVWDERGNLLQDIDANGLVTARTYDDNSRMLTVYPGQAHYGLGGDWKRHFGSDGSLLCAFNYDGSDREQLPDYVSVVSLSSGLREDSGRDLSDPTMWSGQVLEGLDVRKLGQWTSSDQSMSFEVHLSEARAFNLNLYTHSLDQLSVSGSSLDYPEFFGRDIEFEVSDQRGGQKFRVTQNASGVWVTFPVVGDPDHPIKVRAICAQSQHRPTLAAIAFDPFEDRRNRMVYGNDGYLSKTLEATDDPQVEVAQTYTYTSDGRLKETAMTLTTGGTLSESRVTKMFYEDAARNLTRVEDPLHQASAPTLMAYDGNSNLVQLTDPDGREMSFAYDYRRRMVRVEDGLHHVTEMEFDGRGLLSQVTDANLRVTSLLYTPARQVWKITNALNEVTEFSYYPDGLLKSIKDPAGAIVSYSYDDDDQLIQVDYPETEVVLPNFERERLSPQLRMAYDAWERLVAVTGPNGNATDVDNINLLGALNILRNGGAERENGMRNQVPTGWQEDRPGGFTSHSTRSSAQSLKGSHSFPLSVPDSLESGQGHDWVQRRPAGSPGGRYLMSGSAISDTETNFRLRAVVRDFSSGFSEQSTQVAVPENAWTEARGRLDLPGNAQTSSSMPVLHQFRAGLERAASGTVEGYLDELQVLALSQSTQYDGEYACGSSGPDGARMRVVRDRFGRTRKVVDPIGRTVDFAYDARDRILSVTDSQGLSLSYEWDFLGNLKKFIDSRSQETVFVYDLLNRVTQITQPDPAQFETFSYTAAGDLQSYRNCRGQVREFAYDEVHRLIRIDYILDEETTESVLMDYDAVGNLRHMTERNGDGLAMSYDALNRMELTTRSSATGPSWALGNQFDSRGNRTALTSGLARAEYSEARFSQNRYAGTGVTSTIFSAVYNELNQMVSLTDSASNETAFAFDLEGRLAEINHPVEDLQTRYRYDLVGKLLESKVSLDGDELWRLSYGYNLAGERLSQHSVWEDGGNAFEYALDGSGRLVRESINRFVCDGVQDFAAGSNAGTAFGPDGKLRMVARSDDFNAAYLDLQRWEVVLSEPVATAVQMRQNQGLRWASSGTTTLRNGRSQSPGTVYDSSNAGNDYPHLDSIQASDTVGWFEGRMMVKQRLPLVGAFEIRVNKAEAQLFDCHIGLGVSLDRYDTSAGGLRFPEPGQASLNGADLSLGPSLGLFAGEELLVGQPPQLSLRRYLDGSQWRLEARVYYEDGGSASQDEWTIDFTDEPVYAYLHLSGKVGRVCWSDFVEVVGLPYSASGASYESRVYDAGRSVDWTRISWNELCPTGTDVSFQVAVSEDPDGPWTYGSALTTAAGTAIADTTGRYARFKVSMTSDGSDTPAVHDIQLTHEGTSGSRVTRWAYDEAGNITEQARVTDAGTETDVRTYNNLNQLTTRSGGWTYQYDFDGNLTGKNNGATEGCENWEFTWEENSRLVQVKKGVYDGTQELVNEFQVDYQYDEAGRMLWRDDGIAVTTYLWDAWDLVSEHTGETATDYLVPSAIVRAVVKEGQRYIVHCDGLGSVRVVTDEVGQVLCRNEFDAWGRVLDEADSGVTASLLFTGSLGVRTDLLTGLTWMRARWYDSDASRFLSRDPIGLLGGSNQYTYVLNPTIYTDRTGLDKGEDFKTTPPKVNNKFEFGKWQLEYHAQDADGIGSNPHLHIKEGPKLDGIRTRGHKINMVTGEVYTTTAGGVRAGRTIGYIKPKTALDWMSQDLQRGIKTGNGSLCGLAVDVLESGKKNTYRAFSKLLNWADENYIAWSKSAGKGLGGFMMFVGVGQFAEDYAHAAPCDRGKVILQHGGGQAFGLVVGGLLLKFAPTISTYALGPMAAGAAGWQVGTWIDRYGIQANSTARGISEWIFSPITSAYSNHPGLP